jgi:hypothetical protein
MYWQPDLALPAAPTTPNPLTFIGMTPCRVVDTRAGSGFTGAFGFPSLVGGMGRTFPMQSSTTCSIPATAQAYSLNITVVPPGLLGYISVWPTGQPQPLVSTLNDLTGTIVANAAIVPAGTSGSIDVYASNNTDIVIDINGYYALQSAITLAGGTAVAPSFTFSGDPGTGIFQSAAGFLNFATGGTNRLTIRSDGDLDLSGNIRQNGSLFLHTRGAASNIGVGISALSNPTGNNNSAVGSFALFSNTTGCCNSAVGNNALWQNTTAGGNVAVGDGGLYSNTTGQGNIAVGRLALGSNTTGGNNIAIGTSAGSGVSAGNSNNIHIGNQGSSTDSGTIRIGTPGTQTSFFAAGVGATVSGVPVLINTATGQLGVASSSRRYKEEIQDMGDSSNGLMRLRPVTFRYQKPFADGSKPVQYGLIAEEVAEVYPDLVAHSADGQIETVKYQVLDSMLLNEVQRLNKENQALQKRLSRLEASMATMASGPGVQ